MKIVRNYGYVLARSFNGVRGPVHITDAGLRSCYVTQGCYTMRRSKAKKWRIYVGIGSFMPSPLGSTNLFMGFDRRTLPPAFFRPMAVS